MIFIAFNFPELFINSALAEEVEYNEPVRNLGKFLLEKKYEVIMHRMDIGTPSNQVSLSEVGFRFNDPA
jgi:hypothetical protein